jgi:phosphocarrier protein
MVEKKVTVSNKMGLHARPCSKLVQKASTYKSDIHLKSGTQMVNGKSIMGVMMLAAAMGTELLISAQGADEEQAAAALVELFESKFGED